MARQKDYRSIKETEGITQVAKYQKKHLLEKHESMGKER